MDSHWWCNCNENMDPIGCVSAWNHGSPLVMQLEQNHGSPLDVLVHEIIDPHWLCNWNGIMDPHTLVV